MRLNPITREVSAWYRKAADQGQADAQFELAYMSSKGVGTKKDYTQSIRWYLKAAEQGHVKAQSNLALMYQEGEGVKINYARAAQWHRKAAEQGNERSLLHLTDLYYEGGYGLKKNVAFAYAWLLLAKEAEFDVDEFLVEYKSKMSSESVKKANAIAREWRQRIAKKKAKKKAENKDEVS